MDTRLTTTHGMWQPFLAAVVALSLVMTLGATSAAAGSATCLVMNTDTGRTHTRLQQAVDAAKPGAQLVVKGTCIGATVIGKKLIIVGKRTKRLGKPKLSGGGTVELSGHGRVGILRVKRSAWVRLRSLEILRGRGLIVVVHPRGRLLLSDVLVHRNRPWHAAVTVSYRATLVMNGSSRVSQNRRVGWMYGDDVAGVMNHGTLVMNDSSSIDGNVGQKQTAEYLEIVPGVWNYGRFTMNDFASVRDNANGGVINGQSGSRFGRLIMNDSSAIRDNTKGYGVLNQGTLVMNDSSIISGNSFLVSGILAEGGGIHNSGSVTLNDSSVVRDNAAPLGGGVSLYGADRPPPTLTMTGSATITGNTATVHGGGIYVKGGASLTGVNCAPHTYANVYGNTPDDCYFEP